MLIVIVFVILLSGRVRAAVYSLGGQTNSGNPATAEKQPYKDYDYLFKDPARYNKFMATPTKSPEIDKDYEQAISGKVSQYSNYYFFKMQNIETDFNRMRPPSLTAPYSYDFSKRPKDNLEFGIYRIKNEKDKEKKKVTLLFQASLEKPDVLFFDIQTKQPLSVSMDWTKETEYGHVYVHFDESLNTTGVILGVLNKHFFQFGLDLQKSFDYRIDLPAATVEPSLNVSYSSGSEDTTKVLVKALEGRGIKGKLRFDSREGNLGDFVLNGTLVNSETGLVEMQEDIRHSNFVQQATYFSTEELFSDELIEPEPKQVDIVVMEFEFLTNTQKVNGHFQTRMKGHYGASEGRGWLLNDELYEVFEFSVHENTSKGPFTEDFVSAKFRHRSVSCQHSAHTPCTLFCDAFFNSNSISNIRILKKDTLWDQTLAKVETNLEDFDFDHRATVKGSVDNSKPDFVGNYECVAYVDGGNRAVDKAEITRKVVPPLITNTSLEPLPNKGSNMYNMYCSATGTKPIKFRIFCEEASLGGELQTTRTSTQYDEDEDFAMITTVFKPQPCTLFCSAENGKVMAEARFS